MPAGLYCTTYYETYIRMIGFILCYSFFPGVITGIDKPPLRQTTSTPLSCLIGGSDGPLLCGNLNEQVSENNTDTPNVFFDGSDDSNFNNNSSISEDEYDIPSFLRRNK